MMELSTLLISFSRCQGTKHSKPLKFTGGLASRLEAYLISMKIAGA
uniref:Uncharacterized protein n=1 Tax=Arundo donax TaxID=35708 RepID=A0A0A9EGI0_ARUDO